MNYFGSFTLLTILIPFILINAQTVTGKFSDQNGKAISGASLQMYIASKAYTATSESDGSFTFKNITNVKNETLPDGFAVSENFPNPFNPRTRIVFSTPKITGIKINVFNAIGQVVKEVPEKLFPMGTNYIDLELNGLPNGFYVAQLIIDGKQSVTRKLMLLYGSQHLNITGGGANITLNKPECLNASTSETKIDSLVISGDSVYRKTFTKLPLISGESLNLGNLNTLTPCPGTPFIDYGGKKYNTILIGAQCWMKENIDIGTMITGTEQMSDNNVIEKYCYANKPENCLVFGGLYQWGEATQYTAGEKAQGICPPGWHIPSKTELYDVLSASVNGNGNKLKSEGQGSGEGAGINTSGFSALLDGYRSNIDGNFYSDGGTSFWSSTEASTQNAHYIYLLGNYSNILQNNKSKQLGLYVRCLKGDGISGNVPKTPVLYSPVDKMASNKTDVNFTWQSGIEATNFTLQVSESNSFSGFVYNKSEIIKTKQLVTGLANNKTYYWRVSASNNFGTSGYSPVFSFSIKTDSSTAPCSGITSVEYAGKIYHTVEIGKQCWFRENLQAGTMVNVDNDQTDNNIIEKYCYLNDTANCNLYGAYYLWDETMQYGNEEKSQGICPFGWHIPSIAEFDSLSVFVKGDGSKLKREEEGGTNETGFSALMTGVRTHSMGSYTIFDKGHMTEIWSSTDYRALYLSKALPNITLTDKTSGLLGFNIRCIKD